MTYWARSTKIRIPRAGIRAVTAAACDALRISYTARIGADLLIRSPTLMVPATDTDYVSVTCHTQRRHARACPDHARLHGLILRSLARYSLNRGRHPEWSTTTYPDESLIRTWAEWKSGMDGLDELTGWDAPARDRLLAEAGRTTWTD